MNVCWNFGDRHINVPITNEDDFIDVVAMMERRGWEDHFVVYRADDLAGRNVSAGLANNTPVVGDDIEDSGPIIESGDGTKRASTNISGDKLNSDFSVAEAPHDDDGGNNAAQKSESNQDVASGGKRCHHFEE